MSGTCQEVELDRSPTIISEAVHEVEDVVSADTNNAAHNLASYRTGSNVLMDDTQDGLYNGRIKADSAL